MPKLIRDSLYEVIKLSDLAISIIDTPHFQRLRYIKQLGVCYFSFPSANHTRFEHSLGVYHLAGEFVEKLIENSKTVHISDSTKELIKIAGLVHDLGHGAFSHVLDNILKQLIKENSLNNQNLLENKKNVSFEHEKRSCYLFRDLVDKFKIPLVKRDVDFVCNLIDPPSDCKGYLYQIIANKESDIDVDKIDYLMRDTITLNMPFGVDYKRILHSIKVVDNDIVYDMKIGYDLWQLFSARYRLHKQVYQHHAVKAIEFLISDIIKLYNDNIRKNILDFFNSYEDFLLLTDDILPHMNRIENRPQKLLELLHRRKGYKMIYEKDLGDLVLDIDDTETIVSFLNESNNDYIYLEGDKFEIFKYSLTGGGYNPLSKIKFIDKMGKVNNVDPLLISNLIGNNCFERGIRVYRIID